MSLDRQTKLSSLTITDGALAVPGFSSASIESWTYVGVAPNGGSVIQCDEQIAITKILQGGLLFEDPSTFSAGAEYGVTTTMPNANAPIIDTVYCDGVGIWRVRQVIDSNTIVIEDPASLATTLSASLMYGLCSRYSPPTELQFSGVSTSGFWMYCLDGTISVSDIKTPFKIEAGDGSAIQPFIAQANLDVIVNITY